MEFRKNRFIEQKSKNKMQNVNKMMSRHSLSKAERRITQAYKKYIICKTKTCCGYFNSISPTTKVKKKKKKKRKKGQQQHIVLVKLLSPSIKVGIPTTRLQTPLKPKHTLVNLTNFWHSTLNTHLFNAVSFSSSILFFLHTLFLSVFYSTIYFMICL